MNTGKLLSLRVFHKIAPAVLTALILAAAGAQADVDSPRTRAVLLKAHTHIRQKQYAAAEKILKSHIEHQPDAVSATVCLLLGNVLYQQEKTSEALQIYRKGLIIEPDNYSLCLNCAVASYETEAYGGAGDFFEKACSIKQSASGRNRQSQPSQADECRKLLHQAAISYYQAEDFRTARRVLQELLERYTETDPEWLKLLVHTCIALNDIVLAQQTLERYLNTTPGNPEYWKLLAHLRFEREQYPQAAAALAVAVALSPKTNPRDAKNLAEIYLYLGAPLQAARVLEASCDNATTADVYRRISDAYTRAHRYDRAIAFLDKADEISATENACLPRARLLHSSGRSDDALAALNPGRCGTGKNGRLHLLRGSIAWDLARWETARTELTLAAREPKVRDQALPYLSILKSLDAARNEPPPGFKPDTSP